MIAIYVYAIILMLIGGVIWWANLDEEKDIGFSCRVIGVVLLAVAYASSEERTKTDWVINAESINIEVVKNDTTYIYECTKQNR